VTFSDKLDMVGYIQLKKVAIQLFFHVLAECINHLWRILQWLWSKQHPLL